MIILDNRQSNDWLVVNIWLVVESIYLIFMKMDSHDWVYAQTGHNHIDQPTSQWLNIFNQWLLAGWQFGVSAGEVTSIFASKVPLQICNHPTG